MLSLQFMEDFPPGLPGGSAVSPVGRASKWEADCATALFQPMAGSHAKGQIQKLETVKISCVQVRFCTPSMGICLIDTNFSSLPVDCPVVSTFSWNVLDGTKNVHLCLVNGHWSEWSLWEECTRSCGRGNRSRTRTCSNPSALHGGRPCEGSAVETIMCNVRPCPGEIPIILG